MTRVVFFGGPWDGAVRELDPPGADLGETVEATVEGEEPWGCYEITYEGDPGHAIARWVPASEEPEQ